MCLPRTVPHLGCRNMISMSLGYVFAGESANEYYSTSPSLTEGTSMV